MIRMIAAVRATITTAALLIGAPVLFMALGGNPLPRRPPSVLQVEVWLDNPLQPHYAAATVRAVAWLIWAMLAAAILAIGVLRVRRWRWARVAVYLPGPAQGLAATLLGAATVTTAVGVPAAHAAPVTTSDTATPGTTSTTDSAVSAAAVRATADGHPHRPGHASATITVRPGDTLWDIAANRLGDPYRWKQLYRLNTSRYPHMSGGDHIEPGWTLTLPTSTVAPRPRPTHPGTAAPTSPATGPTALSTSTSPAPSAGPSTPSPAARTGQPGSPAAAHPDRSATNPERDTAAQPPAGGITLPSGSWIDLGLATAISAAIAVIWAHRRRRYRRHPLTADLRLHDPDLAPMPPVINQIRRRLRRGTIDTNPRQTSAPDNAEYGVPASLPRAHDERHDPESPTGHADPDDPNGHDDPGKDNEQDDFGEATGEHTRSERLGVSLPPAPRPVVPSLAHPLVDLWPPAGLGLTGPGAQPAARGMLTAALAAGGVDAPDERGCVVMPAADAAALLGVDTEALSCTPRLRVTADLDEALDLLDARTLHRNRILDAHEVDTVAELRAADPAEEPLPPIMLLADAATHHHRTRIAALLAQGRSLDIHGLLIGAWPEGDTIEVAADGTTTPDRKGSRHGGAHPADIGRLAVLTAPETMDLLHTVAESHTGQQQAPTVMEPAAHTTRDTPAAPHTVITTGEHDDEAATTPSTSTSPAAPSSPGATPDENPHFDETGIDLHEAAGGTSAQPADAEPRPSTAVTRRETTPDDAADAHSPAVVAAGEATGGQPATAPGLDNDRAEAGTFRTGRAQITILGPAGILGLPAGVTPRRKSVELLVYLAVHDGEASAEAILDDVLGDVPASKAPGRLYTYVSDLRTVLRRTAGHGTHISHPGQSYVLNRDLIDVDLWRMHAAIRDTALATLTADPAERQTALRRAVDAYSGPLADGADYEWIEPYREAVRQQALDAFLALADALTDTPAEQITVLDTAISHNRYTEQLYQQAMRTRAELGHVDAIRTLRRALTRALDEIDAEPTDETITLADQLVAQLQRARPAEPRRAPRPGEGAAA